MNNYPSINYIKTLIQPGLNIIIFDLIVAALTQYPKIELKEINLCQIIITFSNVIGAKLDEDAARKRKNFAQIVITLLRHSPSHLKIILTFSLTHFDKCNTYRKHLITAKARKQMPVSKIYS